MYILSNITINKYLNLFSLIFFCFFLVSCSNDEEEKVVHWSEYTGWYMISMQDMGIMENGVWGVECYYSNGTAIRLKTANVTPRLRQNGTGPEVCPPRVKSN